MPSITCSKAWDKLFQGLEYPLKRLSFKRKEGVSVIFDTSPFIYHYTKVLITLLPVQ